MMKEFISELLNQGPMTECIYCGKITLIENTINGSCPNCLKK